MSPSIAAQYRRARRLLQILQMNVSATKPYYREAEKRDSGTANFIRSDMLADLYIKVEVELDEEEELERVAAEICRQIEKLYAVRSAELSNSVVRE